MPRIVPALDVGAKPLIGSRNRTWYADFLLLGVPNDGRVIRNWAEGLGVV